MQAYQASESVQLNFVFTKTLRYSIFANLSTWFLYLLFQVGRSTLLLPQDVNVLMLPIYLVFFICFRETLETSIIVSVLLAFLKQTLGHDQDLATYRRLKRQVSIVEKPCASREL